MSKRLLDGGEAPAEKRLCTREEIEKDTEDAEYELAKLKTANRKRIVEFERSKDDVLYEIAYFNVTLWGGLSTRRICYFDTVDKAIDFLSRPAQPFSDYNQVNLAIRIKKRSEVSDQVLIDLNMTPF